MSFLFADFVRTMRGIPEQEADQHIDESSPAFRFYLAWLTFPPILLFVGQPFGLVLIYAALGALSMPFLAITLLMLLNSDRVRPEFRNRVLPNAVMIACVVLFGFLASGRSSRPYSRRPEGALGVPFPPIRARPHGGI